MNHLISIDTISTIRRLKEDLDKTERLAKSLQVVISRLEEGITIEIPDKDFEGVKEGL